MEAILAKQYEKHLSEQAKDFYEKTNYIKNMFYSLSSERWFKNYD